MNLVITVKEDIVGNTYFIVNSTDGKGNEVVKYLSCPQLLKLLNSSYEPHKICIPLGQIAEGYIDSTFCLNGSGRVKMYVPAQQRAVLLEIPNMQLPKVFNVPMPPMLFEIEFGGRRLGGRCCIVKGSYKEVKEQYYDHSMVGYMYPFGNVNASAEICMGNIEYDIKTVSEAPEYISAFFDGITSFHYVNKSRVKSGKLQMDFLSELDGKKRFPYKELLMLHERVNEDLCRPYSRVE